MNNKIEKEVTYFTKSKDLNMKLLMDILCNKTLESKEDNNQVNILKYRDRIQLLLDKGDYDKYKLTFKVNHGDITYSIATKNRLTSTDELIQSYEETITNWKPIEEIDLGLFNNAIIAFYYKEIYKINVKYKNIKYKLIGHDVKFLDLHSEVKDQIKYVEIESKNFDYNHVNFFTDLLYKQGLSLIDYDNSKLAVGKEILGKQNQLDFTDISELKDLITNIYIKMSLYNLV